MKRIVTPGSTSTSEVQRMAIVSDSELSRGKRKVWRMSRMRVGMCHDWTAHLVAWEGKKRAGDRA